MAIPKKMACVGLGAATILLVPLIAMQFTDEVRWDWFDFLAAGMLLVVSGGSYVLLANRMDNRVQKAVLAIALGIGLLAVWMELAVGVFGTPFAGR
ncbi:MULTISPECIES: hypothetical protein [unclassified Duganella]|uniref:hypothetical protein n=1 Tax=unclassified Duganella TaxID=2636909 RepID=UPI0006FFF7B5|nr:MULTISPECIES: hypothetical protein [unclassified Duganella]KQV51243.1 hypothetical protein ASD07_10075 [Duganella sp. Root336D2]